MFWIEMDKRRPCIVVSSADVLGVAVWQTHVVPLTSKAERAASTGLPQDSVAVPLGLELIDRSLLSAQTGRLPQILLDDIDDGLRAISGL